MRQGLGNISNDGEFFSITCTGYNGKCYGKCSFGSETWVQFREMLELGLFLLNEVGVPLP